MPSINYGTGRARAALVRAGLVFNERFESAAEIVNNGGVITGTAPINSIFSGNATNRINYSGNINGVITKMTIVINDVVASTDVNTENCIISSLKSGSSGFTVDWALNRLYFFVGGATANCYIAATAGQVINNLTVVYDGTQAANADKLNIYLDGVLQAKTIAAGIPTSFLNPNNITVGAWADNAYILKAGGKLGRIQIYKNAFDAATILSIANGTIWNYDNNCVLWMDGKLRNYDPTNNKHLDASRAGNHLTFGDGATVTTFPTKLTTKGGGYGFDGIADYMRSRLSANMGNTFTISYYGKCTASDPAYTIFNFYDENKKYYLFYTTGTGFIYGVANKYTTRALSLSDFPKSKVKLKNHWLLVFNKTAETIKVYVNGLLADTITGGANEAVTALDVANNIYIGTLATSATYCALDIGKFSIHNQALNQIQIIDLYIRMSQDTEV